MNVNDGPTRPYVVNPEAVGDPNQTPVVALVREARNDLAAVVKELDEARAELERIKAGIEGVCDRIEANGRGTSLEIVTDAFCAEFRAVLSGGVSGE